MTGANGSGASASQATSRSLIARVRTHDAGAWDRLVALYAPFVFAHCRQARLPAEDAADVFQEVFQAAYARIESFEKKRSTDTFRGWLRTITRNKVTDHFRRQQREPRGVGGTQIQLCMAELQAPEQEASTTQEPEERAELRLFHGALDGIRDGFKENTWRAFLLTAVDGRSPKDAGEELGMSPGAVRVAKSRVLQRLRSELGDLPA